MTKPTKTKSGKYQVRLSLGKDASGKRLYYKETFSTKEEAQAAIHRIMHEGKTIKRYGMTLDDAMEQFHHCQCNGAHREHGHPTSNTATMFRPSRRLAHASGYIILVVVGNAH